MISNLSLLFYAIAKVLLWNGVGPGIAVAIVCERLGTDPFCLAISVIRFRSSGDGQLAQTQSQRFDTSSVEPWATSPSRKVKVA